MMLPPLGQIGTDNQAEAVEYLAGLARESIDAATEWIEMAVESVNVYTYGDDPLPNDEELVVNEIQNHVISSTNIQTADPPTVTLEPVETGEPPICYWGGPQAAGIQLGLPAPMVAANVADPMTGALQPPLPLDEQQSDAIHQMISAGMIPKPEWLVEVNDQLVADVYQQVFDVFWQRTNTDLWVRNNLLWTNVKGWNCGLYEFDDDEKRHILSNLSLHQVYIDPTVENIAEAAYVGLDLYLDADYAKRRFPQIRAAIETNARDGRPTVIDQSATIPDHMDIAFNRNTVVMRVFWLRNQELPMTPEEALGRGLVEEQFVETPVVADPAMPEAVSVMQQSASLFLVESGEPTSPDADNWPARWGIRRIVVIEGQVVSDSESETWDIPVLHNVNLPVPNRPFGMGEPYRLKIVQRKRSKMLNSIAENAEYASSPMTVMSSLIAEQFPEGKRGMRPGRVMVVDHADFMQLNGKIEVVLTPPPLPEALIQGQSILKSEITEQSGHAEVLQGRAQPQIKSGRAIELLQSAAGSMIGFKSQRTGDMIERLARLMLHSIVWRLGVSDIGKIVSKYKPHILAAIHSRAREIEWNVAVTVASGNGAVKTQKRQQDLAELQTGVITLETYRERNGIDHRLEQQRQEQALQKQVQLQQQMAPQMPAGPAPAQEQPQPQ